MLVYIKYACVRVCVCACVSDAIIRIEHDQVTKNEYEV